jgi:8-oxo-dGTP pyrophosphatase MutT (NUDIX family)
MDTRRTQKYDNNPALKGKQGKLPDALQKKIITARLKHAIEKKAELAHKRTDDGVRVGRKLYRPKVQTFMYDDKGRILAAKSQGAGSGLRAYSNYKFPGGGVEAGENISEAARKELLEEAGYEPAGDMFEFGTPTPVDWDKSFRAQARKKGRGRYAGQYEYYAAGPLGKRNTSLFGSEGDQMSDLEMVPLSRLRRDLTRTANDPGNEYGYFDKQKLVALDALKRELDQRGVKTAGIATKRDPEKWSRAKADAKARMGGKHSARAMQLATKLYKQRGGSYAGKKPSSSSNKLRKWTKQDWQWSGGDKKGPGGSGVYLPKRSASALKSTEQGRAKLERASRTKASATARGQQFSSHGLHVGKKRGDVT